jgi:aryl-alcohol dehydrogenase-like predicted oxidoreductase
LSSPPTGRIRNSIPRLAKAEIQADLDLSLERLGVEWIDLYWLRRDSPGFLVEEIL